MKDIKYVVVILALVFGVIYLWRELRIVNNVLENEIQLKHSYDNELKEFKAQHFDKQISNLKHENKALYDSIKKYKDKVTYLAQFKYKKQYNIVSKVTKQDTVKQDVAKTNVYEYANEKNDSLTYNLKIASKVEPEWYKLDITVSDNFTIINNKTHNLNETTISSSNKGYIDNVTVFSKKSEKNKFWNRFNVGPVVAVGYDVANKDFGVVLGVGISYNLFPKK